MNNILQLVKLLKLSIHKGESYTFSNKILRNIYKFKVDFSLAKSWLDTILPVFKNIALIIFVTLAKLPN